MTARNEIKTVRIIVRGTDNIKGWDDLSQNEKRRLAYAWNSAAMAEVGFAKTTQKPLKQAVAV
jgi:hypothetical protein